MFEGQGKVQTVGFESSVRMAPSDFDLIQNGAV
jgi:hypothetical protein